MNSENTIRVLEQVSLNYEDVEVFNDLSLDILKNKITCIVGPSGCGKTSLLNMLSGLLKPSKGHVRTEDERVGYIFQEDRLLPWETVYQNIKLVDKKENKEEILELLRALELAEFKDKFPHQLSGGMKQRVSIARGFYYQSSLLLMDEPFKSLDYDLRVNLINYLAKLWEQKHITIVFVTHDLDEALLLGHQVVVLSHRPTTISHCFTIQSELGIREINEKDHLEVRDQIIKLMTN